VEQGHGIRVLADEIYDTVMAASPVDATQLGERRFDAALPDLTPDGQAALAITLERLAGELDAVDPDDLSVDEQVTRDVAAHVLASTRHQVRAAYVEFAAGPMASGANIGSAASALLIGMPKLVVETPEQAGDYIQRCRAIPAHLLAAEEQLRAGAAGGRTPAQRLLALTMRQIERYLATDVGADPLLTPAAAWGTDTRVELERVLAGEVRPAFIRHRDVLTDDVMPHARSDDRVGLCWLPDGDATYREAAALHTTTTSTPEELHQLGLELVADLGSEYHDLGARVLGAGAVDVAGVFDHLRNAGELRFATGRQILDSAEVALTRAQSAMATWFATVPSTPCEVREIPAVEAPESTIAYYHPPTLDGRPGQYFVNTSQPRTRTRFEAEALAFHESVPGHHTQIARAIELDLPVLQRVFYVTAFAEGWALYAERLADEMDLYSDDTARLGMLSFDSWRACRLVVDTGMHAFGWSRQRAVEYMHANSPQAPNNIANEVDRYIGWPGQALAYMTGRTRIMALRQRAERMLGSAFDIAEFHDVVLGHAAVPLWTLERLVDRWIAREGHGPVTG
jgi:uncharacterized protein (DUF885 family)